MSEKIIIVSDSTSDLPPEIIDRYNVRVLPLGVTLGEEQYLDGVDVTPDLIYSHYEKTGELPKTSAVNMADFADAFEEYTKEGFSVICFTISSQMSSTFNNARMAAEELEGVYVVDSANLSSGVGLLICAAGDMIKSGMAAKDIYERIMDMRSCVSASFVIDDLEFLHKGGRCSALAAFGANLLKLKPCIVVKDGKMGVAKKYRGSFDQVLKTYVKDMIGDGGDIVLDRIFVTHAGCEESIIADCAESAASLAPFGEVIVARAGCTISSHCGKNTLGVLFIKKSPVE